ncbi:DUF732 domain-containing protein [Corynebacterium aquatimens]|uniref:Small lipoprotein YifL n=1 Tax=Corynebacterium aquatimens TaxID=1190508 RepID=A0A931GUJ5_9CORY|nr:DUF732 domain-containing protein [Corynebacterium aquatimens]MBG6122850.1 putative small lipoprotein YifL [Corynebacterium aquatimens]WJY66815.1 hypothetical protein CAQUA_10645 [Corynebacterium aquatimens]
MRKLVAVTLAAATAFSLAACGGKETVENDAPASKSAVPTVTTQASASSSENAPSESEPASNEGPAREVSEEPTAAEIPTGDEEFLNRLRDAGVNVEGDEQVLISTAQGVCADNMVTRDAVAGQLIEQQRTSLSFEELTKLIDDSARATVCP